MKRVGLVKWCLIILQVILAFFAIVFEIINFMLNNNPEDLKPAIVKWLRFLVSEENLPSFLYSIHSSEQIPFFVYIHKIIVVTVIAYFFYFMLKKVKNCSVVRCSYYWLFQFVSSMKNKKEPVFISLHDAIAKIIQQLDIKQLWKDYRFDDYTIYPCLGYKKYGRFEDSSLLAIFTLIQEEKLILYGHKMIDSDDNCIDTRHLGLQRIPKEFLSTCDIYDRATWSGHYNEICNPYCRGEYYVNISIKSAELDNFIKQHKLTS
jgi:hypothetical protein